MKARDSSRVPRIFPSASGDGNALRQRRGKQALTDARSDEAEAQRPRPKAATTGRSGSEDPCGIEGDVAPESGGDRAGARDILPKCGTGPRSEPDLRAGVLAEADLSRSKRAAIESVGLLVTASR